MVKLGEKKVLSSKRYGPRQVERKGWQMIMKQTQKKASREMFISNKINTKAKREIH